MKTETFEFAGYSGTNLPAYLWLPDGEVKQYCRSPTA